MCWAWSGGGWLCFILYGENGWRSRTSVNNLCSHQTMWKDSIRDNHDFSFLQCCWTCVGSANPWLCASSNRSHHVFHLFISSLCLHINIFWKKAWIEKSNGRVRISLLIFLVHCFFYFDLKTHTLSSHSIFWLK